MISIELTLERCFRDSLPRNFLMILELLFFVSWIVTKSSNNFFIDEIYIQGITKYDIDDNCWCKLKCSNKVACSYQEIRDGIVTP